MGICSSCLGFGRGPDAENPETSRLLYDDPYRSQYGGVQHPQRTVYSQPDPESLRREREALERITNAMSDDIVDVFTVLPPSAEQPRPETIEAPHKKHAENEEERAYKTIRRGNSGPILSSLNKDESGWRAAKTIMG